MRNPSGLSPRTLPAGKSDLDDFDYPVHGKADIGAYEETTFIDGFNGH